jgi:hypothetical protein
MMMMQHEKGSQVLRDAAGSPTESVTEGMRMKSDEQPDPLSADRG